MILLGQNHLILFEAKFFHLCPSMRTDYNLGDDVLGAKAEVKVHGFQNLSVFNTQKSFKISLRQMFISKLTILDKNICNYATFLSAVF